MAKWLELAYTAVSKTVGLIARARSNRALATMFTLLACLLSVNAQEEEYYPQDPPLIPKVDELKEMRREKIKSVLCNVLLERYLLPFDNWVKSGGYGKDNVYRQAEELDSEVWFALVIRDGQNDPIWVKFFTKRNITILSDLGPSQSNDLINWQAGRIRIGLKASLEQNFIILMTEEESLQSMIYGEAHLYRLITKDTPIDKIRKEDMVY